jgi:hypothetical protein
MAIAAQRYIFSVNALKPAQRAVVANEVNGIVGNDEEPGGHPDREVDEASFRRFLPWMVARAKPILRPNDITREPETVHKKMADHNCQHSPDGADEQERQAVKHHMAHRRPGMLGLVLGHPIALGQVIADKMQDELFHRVIG